MKRRPKQQSKTKKPDTKPLSQDYVKFIKCIFHGPVNVNTAPSSKKYSFQPGQTQPIRNEADFQHLIGLQRKSGSEIGAGCCGGKYSEPRFYFEVVT